MPKFTVTYEVVTPESAEHGDYAEIGFAMPGGWQYPIETAEAKDVYAMTLREAIGMMGAVEDSGRWFTEVDGNTDYVSGAETRRSLHPYRTITPSSYARLARLLGA